MDLNLDSESNSETEPNEWGHIALNHMCWPLLTKLVLLETSQLLMF
jgi:hypothetical protein